MSARLTETKKPTCVKNSTLSSHDYGQVWDTKGSNETSSNCKHSNLDKSATHKSLWWTGPTAHSLSYQALKTLVSSQRVQKHTIMQHSLFSLFISGSNRRPKPEKLFGGFSVFYFQKHIKTRRVRSKTQWFTARCKNNKTCVDVVSFLFPLQLVMCK